MSATATLEITPYLALAPDARRVVIDCRHAQTVVICAPGSGPDAATFTDAALVRAALVRRSLERPGCRCARTISKRYGVTS